MLLAALTVVATVAAYVLLRGVWRQTSVLIGMAAGTVVAVTTGLGAFAPAAGSGFALPAFLPFGTPRFDLVAALPLLVFSLTTLAEITGQTVLNSETVGRTPVPERDVPRVARADALVSLAGGLFGTSLMVTSAENIGIGRLTGVRSRFVTAGAGRRPRTTSAGPSLDARRSHAAPTEGDRYRHEAAMTPSRRGNNPSGAAFRRPPGYETGRRS